MEEFGVVEKTLRRTRVRLILNDELLPREIHEWWRLNLASCEDWIEMELSG